MPISCEISSSHFIRFGDTFKEVIWWYWKKGNKILRSQKIINRWDLNKTDQMLEWTLASCFSWLRTLSGIGAAEQSVLWMKGWSTETWMSTQALTDGLLMKYSKNHLQGGWKFLLLRPHAFDKKNYIHQIIIQMLDLGTEKITWAHMHPNVRERFVYCTLFPWVKVIKCLPTSHSFLLTCEKDIFCYPGYAD